MVFKGTRILKRLYMCKDTTKWDLASDIGFNVFG
jgi:hypothetical protein